VFGGDQPKYPHPKSLERVLKPMRTSDGTFDWGLRWLNPCSPPRGCLGLAAFRSSSAPRGNLPKCDVRFANCDGRRQNLSSTHPHRILKHALTFLLTARHHRELVRTLKDALLVGRIRPFAGSNHRSVRPSTAPPGPALSALTNFPALNLESRIRSRVTPLEKALDTFLRLTKYCTSLTWCRQNALGQSVAPKMRIRRSCSSTLAGYSP
jgi:hypothetical protein